MVIANALNEINSKNWNPPYYSAFNKDEIQSIYNWVKEGGSLLLIADHIPFPKASEQLAKKFGFEFINGFAINKKNKITIFSENEKTLDEVVTKDIPPTNAKRPSRFRPVVESTSGPGGNRTC